MLASACHSLHLWVPGDGLPAESPGFPPVQSYQPLPLSGQGPQAFPPYPPNQHKQSYAPPNQNSGGYTPGGVY